MPAKPEDVPAKDEASSANSPGGLKDSRNENPRTTSSGNEKSPREGSSDAAHTDASEDSEDSDASRSPSPAPQGAKADGDSAPPPLPNEPVPQQADDGWEFHWRAEYNAYVFYNRFTQTWQWENPRVPTAAGDSAPEVTGGSAPTNLPPPSSGASAAGSIAGGYNPAIHGDYDPNAWYAQAGSSSGDSAAITAASAAGDADYATGAFFNRATGQWQNPAADAGPEHHSDEAKSRRQMNAYFDVDAAANSHEGRSLRAERAGKKPSKSELKAFKEKRRAKKEEKRRAWLRD